MQGLDKVELLDLDSDGSINGIEWEGTWKEFVDENAEENDGSMDAEELQEITGYLDRGEMHIFGGGAAALFGLRKR
jgi:hypothetical protein